MTVTFVHSWRRVIKSRRQFPPIPHLLVELLHGVDVGLEAIVEVLNGGQLLLDLVVLVQLVVLQPAAQLVQQQLLVLRVGLQRLHHGLGGVRYRMLCMNVVRTEVPFSVIWWSQEHGCVFCGCLTKGISYFLYRKLCIHFEECVP